MIPFRAVVPAGGAGTRLWPLSRAGAPKFLLDLTGTGRTLLQATVDRLLPLAGADGIVVVTGARHLAAVQAQVPASVAVLGEPSPRDSMAAIGLAAAVLVQREGDVVVGSFAADHVIGPEGFESAVTAAIEAAQADRVVTLGIRPRHPATGFGYIRVGSALAAPVGVHEVSDFTEKPDLAAAERYLAQGDYRWNAGMFVSRASVLLGHLARLHPGLHDGLRTIAAAWDTPGRAEVLERVWPQLPRIAIDHALAEPLAAQGHLAVVPAEFTWDDIGDFASVGEVLPADSRGNRTLGDQSLLIDTRDALVASTGPTVVTLGVQGVVVIATADAVLVTTREDAQRVREAVAAVRDAGRDDRL